METPIAASDGTDYLFDKHGRQWRVRVRINAELPTHAPVNGDVQVEPSGVGISVSVALLDADGEVAKTPDGRLRIFPAHVLTMQSDALRVVDPKAEIDRVIQKQIDDAEYQLERKNDLHDALAPFLKVQ